MSLTIKIADIMVDPRDNARVAYGNIAALSKDIIARGQLVPVLVTETSEGKYRLVAGYRRVAALRLARAETVLARVVSGKPLDLALANLVENMAREDLTVYEMARAFVGLKESFKLSDDKISDKLGGVRGCSGQQIGAYRRLFAWASDKPEIVEAWRDPTHRMHGFTSVNRLQDLAKAGEKWQEMWVGWAGLAPSKEPANKGEETAKQDERETESKPSKPSAKDIVAAIDYYKAHNWLAVSEALAWAIGLNPAAPSCADCPAWVRPVKTVAAPPTEEAKRAKAAADMVARAEALRTKAAAIAAGTVEVPTRKKVKAEGSDK